MNNFLEKQQFYAIKKAQRQYERELKKENDIQQQQRPSFIGRNAVKPEKKESNVIQPAQQK